MDNIQTAVFRTFKQSNQNILASTEPSQRRIIPAESDSRPNSYRTEWWRIQEDERNQPEPTNRLFPVDHKKQFNRILDDEKLKVDRQGNRRTLYSLRHSHISFRLLEAANIYQIAKNCRTSVEMIEKHYAVHLKNSLDAAAINVRKCRQPKKMLSNR